MPSSNNFNTRIVLFGTRFAQAARPPLTRSGQDAVPERLVFFPGTFDALAAAVMTK